jgi:hypothetical protein
MVQKGEMTAENIHHSNPGESPNLSPATSIALADLVLRPEFLLHSIRSLGTQFSFLTKSITCHPIERWEAIWSMSVNEIESDAVGYS